MASTDEQVEAETLHTPEYEEEFEEIRHVNHHTNTSLLSNPFSRRYEDFTTIGIHPTLPIPGRYS